MRPKTLQDDKQGQKPGPGTYDVVPEGTTGPKYTMRVKPSLSPEHDKVPGPGTYQQEKEKVSHKNPVWSIGKEERGKLTGAMGPGPGAYDADSQLKKKGAVFGKEDRGKSGLRAGENPGPGQYDARSDINDGLEKKKGKSLGLKLGSSHTNEVPAPWTYNQDIDPLRKSNPKFGFGTSQRNNGGANVNPSPGEYTIKDDYVKHSGPVYGIGTAPRGGSVESKAKSNIGPGSYDLSLKNDSMKRFIKNQSIILDSRLIMESQSWQSPVQELISQSTIWRDRLILRQGSERKKEGS